MVFLTGFEPVFPSVFIYFRLVATETRARGFDIGTFNHDMAERAEDMDDQILDIIPLCYIERYHGEDWSDQS